MQGQPDEGFRSAPPLGEVEVSSVWQGRYKGETVSIARGEQGERSVLGPLRPALAIRCHDVRIKRLKLVPGLHGHDQG
jgi:hypothetical protein